MLLESQVVIERQQTLLLHLALSVATGSILILSSCRAASHHHLVMAHVVCFFQRFS